MKLAITTNDAELLIQALCNLAPENQSKREADRTELLLRRLREAISKEDT